MEFIINWDVHLVWSVEAKDEKEAWKFWKERGFKEAEIWNTTNETIEVI